MPDGQAIPTIEPDLAARSAEREKARLLQTLRERAGEATAAEMARGSDVPRPGDMPPPEPPPAGPGQGGALAVASDVARGLTVQAPRAVGRGVLGGLTEAVKAGREALGEVDLPPRMAAVLGNFGPSEADLDAVAELIPPPETQTGKMVTAVSQFLTGFVAAGRMLKPWAAASRAARTGKAMTQGAVSDYAFFDAAEPGLANLIESQPELANPVTQFLATDPDDEAATNRLKRTLEGLALGGATEGMVAALKTMRGAVKARAAARDAATVAPAKPDPTALEQKLGEQVELDWAALGYDPDAPLVQLRRVQTREQVIRAEQRPIDADAKYGEDIVRAEGLAPPTPRPRPAVAPTPSRYVQRGDRALVTLANGSPDLGDIGEDVAGAAQQAGYQDFKPGKIKLERGWDDPQTGDGLGEAHIEARHGEQVRQAGYSDAAALVADVAENFNRIGRGHSGRLILGKVNGKEKVAIIELEPAAGDYTVRTAGVRNPGWMDRETRVLPWRRADQPAARGSSDPGAQGSADKLGGTEVFVNHLRISSPEDVHDAIQQIADARSDPIDAARRGVRSWGDTRQAAGERDAWADMMEQRAQRGEAIPTAERQLAMRELWISSAEKLTEAAEQAAKSPTPGNRFAFRRLLAIHHAIQSEVIAARTETARALNQWRMPAGATRERLRAIESALAEGGGADTHDQLARAIAAFRGREGEYARAIDTVARQGWLARSRDAALSVWINGLLSGPKTHVANMLSNTSVIALAQVERRAGESISRALDSADGVAAGEAVAQYHGMIEGFKDLFRLSGDSSFWRYLKGEVQAPGPSKMDHAAKKGAVDPLSAEAWGVAANTFPGSVIDFLAGAAKLPGAALEAEDFIFKSMNYRMELHAQALRQATREVHAGAIPPEQMKARMADLVAEPTEQIRLDATEAALVNTFTNTPGRFGQGVSRLVSDHPAMRLIVPFVRTPVNLFRFAAERSPAAPLVRQWRADIAAGGARRDLALARMATGTAIMMVALDLAQGGQITGSAPAAPGEREMFSRVGKKEYAVKLGNTWVQFSRLDPLGTTLGIAGDLAAAFSGDFDEDYDEDATRAITAAVFAAAYNATSKTYLSGLSGLMRGAIYGGEAAENEIKGLIGSAVPAGVGEVTRAVDPVLRDAADLTDAFVRRTPWASESLPKQRDLWGREVSLQSGLGVAYDILSPAYASRENAAPIDRELRTLGYFPSKPPRKVRFPAGWSDSVEINLRSFDPHLYERYVALSGNKLKHPVWGLGLFDLANKIVAGKHDLAEVYRARPADRRAEFWQNLIHDYRDKARRQILDESPELRREIAERHHAQRTAPLGEVP